MQSQRKDSVSWFRSGFKLERSFSLSLWGLDQFYPSMFLLRWVLSAKLVLGHLSGLEQSCQQVLGLGYRLV